MTTAIKEQGVGWQEDEGNCQENITILCLVFRTETMFRFGTHCLGPRKPEEERPCTAGKGKVWLFSQSFPLLIHSGDKERGNHQTFQEVLDIEHQVVCCLQPYAAPESRNCPNSPKEKISHMTGTFQISASQLRALMFISSTASDTIKPVTPFYGLFQLFLLAVLVYPKLFHAIQNEVLVSPLSSSGIMYSFLESFFQQIFIQ